MQMAESSERERQMGILAWTPRGPARRVVVVVLPFAIEFGSGIRRGLRGKRGGRPPSQGREGGRGYVGGGRAGQTRRRVAERGDSDFLVLRNKNDQEREESGGA